MAKFDDISLFGPGEPDPPESIGEEQTQEGAVSEAAPSALEEQADESFDQSADNLSEFLAPLGSREVTFHESADEWHEAEEYASPVTVDLKEHASVRKEGKVWEVVVIREGFSLNGRYYTRESLAESIPLWEGTDVCSYGWDPHRRDHVPNHVERAFPAGTFENKVGFIRGVRGEVREGRYQLVGEFVCTNPTLRQSLVETLEAKGQMPGFSIHATGELETQIREGRKVQVVTSITHTKELTLVSRPAAGGRGLRLVAGIPTIQTEEEMDLSKVRAFVAGKMPEGVAKSMEVKPLLESAAFYLKEMDGAKALVELAMEFLAAGNNEQALKALEKALSVDGPAPAEMPAEAEEMAPEEDMYEGRAQKNVRRDEDMAALGSKVAEAEAALKKAEEAQKRVELAECRLTLKSKLAESKLPENFKQKVRKQFEGRIFTESELGAEITEMAHLVPSHGGGEARVENTGVRAEVVVEAADKFQYCTNLMLGFDPDKADLTESEKQAYRDLKGTLPTKSTKALYFLATGDEMGKKVGRQGSLTEAFSSSTFSATLGTGINLVLQQLMDATPDAKWQGFAKEVSGADLLQRDRVIIGGLGLAPVVAEGGNYTDLTQPKEYSDNYSLEKRGGYVEVTEEMILKDRVGAVASIPKMLLNSALIAEKDLVYRALTGNLGGSGINTDTSYTGSTLYHANHDNYSTTALSNAGIVAAKLFTKRQMVFATETALDESSNINNSVTSFDVDDASGIRAGMYIRINAEFMKVTGVSSNTLTVVRGMRGSTAAGHTDNDKVFSFAGPMAWETYGGFKMYVVCPTELEDEALVALGSQFLPGGGNNDVNTLYQDFANNRIEIVSEDSSYLGGDVTNWYTAVPWQVSPAIEFGYLDGQRAPQIINQTQDFVAQVFLADTMRYKVKHRLGANNFFHEGLTGHVVSG